MGARLLEVVAISVACAASANAQVTQVAPFTSRCSETEATGFNWENGKWVQVNFAPATLLVHKFDPARHGGETNICDSLEPDDPLVMSEFATLPGCYSFGDANEDPLFEWCEEFYDRIDSQWRLNSVNCPLIGRQLSFKPDGAFVYVINAANLSDKPEDDYKDSLKLSQGRCRRVARP